MVLNALFTASLLGASALVADAACIKPADNTTDSGVVAASYFAGYHIDEGFTVEDIPWDKYSEVKYAFAETTADGSLDLSGSSPESIPAFVSAAKAQNVKALVSVGGWTGSRFFSTSVGSAENRTAFVNTLTALVDQYSLDGLDFDWEYPNRQALGCNAINDNDTANFLAMLQELRATPSGASLYLTAATSLFPWNDATAAQSAGGALAGFADALDYLMIMNYDVFGAWAPTAGPNAPLRSACDARNNQGSLEAALAKWIDAGIPASKLVLGVAAYGHGFSVAPADAFPNGTAAPAGAGGAGAGAALALYPAQNSSERFQGSSWDSDPAVDACGNAQPPGGTYQFWSMVQEMGFLTAAGEVSGNMTAAFDECSATPVLYDAARQIYVSYDNAQSFAIKGQYILDQGLKGFASFETGGDFNNILVDSIRSAVGL